MAGAGRVGQPGRVPVALRSSHPAPLTGPDLLAGLRRIGIDAGAVVMVHAALSRLGWVVGGSETVLRALLDATGPRGTVCAQVSWQEAPLDQAGRPESHRRAYAAAPLPFVPEVAEAARFEGRLAERLRTWPGARRSANADTGVAAFGAHAAWLVDPHPHDDGFGPGTPYARLVEADGHVLLLGAPLHTISLLHHAEAIARVRAKRRVRYDVPLPARGGGVRWHVCEDIDVRGGPFPYARAVPPGEPPLGVIARAALGAGIGEMQPIGAARCHRFPARALVRFASAWLEERFG
jgi:aminoglycoside 3-N-acetyltransferase